MRYAIPSQPLPILDWCEAHFRYPTGPKAGQPYSRHDQPATAMFLELLDSDYWRSAMLVAPNQVGKSLSLVQYVLHVNFNLREDVIFGLPDIDKMWSTKWHKDFLPALNSSDLKTMIPKSGSGSSGGTPKLVLWGNGNSLIPMGAGAGDTQRAGATTRVVVITEMKEFGDVAGGSEEGAKINQLAHRTRAFMGREMVFGESTVTTQKNISWQWFKSGTQSQPYFPCESCEEFIAPEREHLVGWQDARNEEEAREKARFACPCCGLLIDDVKRRQLMQQAVVLHYGQTVDRGRIIGEMPPTRSLSYRFTASTNMLANIGTIAVDEFKARLIQSAVDKVKANRSISQGFFGFPTDEDDMVIDPLDGIALVNRLSSADFGIAPAGSTRLFAGVDVRKTMLHWTVIATGEYMGTRIVAWGEEPILQHIPLEDAILIAGRQLQRNFRDGFPVQGTEEMLPVTLTTMDSGWKPMIVDKVCLEDDFWMPLKGFGEGVLLEDKYKSPGRKSNTVKFIGDGYDIKYLDDQWVVHCDASVGKSELHAALKCDRTSHNVMLIAKGTQMQVRQLVRHLTAEVETVSGESGSVTSTWKKIREDNHLLDSTSYANVSRKVWAFLQDILSDEDAADDGFSVVGDGPLFGKA